MAARTSSRPHAISKAMRLRRRPEFLAVQARGRKLHSTAFLALVVRTSSRPGGSASGSSAIGSSASGRIGFTVTKRIGNAVTRNQIKRRARDWLRRHGWAPPGLDVVLIAKEAAATMTSTALAADLRRLTEKIASC